MPENKLNGDAGLDGKILHLINRHVSAHAVSPPQVIDTLYRLLVTILASDNHRERREGVISAIVTKLAIDVGEHRQLHAEQRLGQQQPN